MGTTMTPSSTPRDRVGLIMRGILVLACAYFVGLLMFPILWGYMGKQNARCFAQWEQDFHEYEAIVRIDESHFALLAPRGLRIQSHSITGEFSGGSSLCDASYSGRRMYAWSDDTYLYVWINSMSFIYVLDASLNIIRTDPHDPAQVPDMAQLAGSSVSGSSHYYARSCAMNADYKVTLTGSGVVRSKGTSSVRIVSWGVMHYMTSYAALFVSLIALIVIGIACDKRSRRGRSLPESEEGR